MSGQIGPLLVYVASLYHSIIRMAVPVCLSATPVYTHWQIQSKLSNRRLFAHITSLYHSIIRMAVPVCVYATHSGCNHWQIQRKSSNMHKIK